MRNTLLLVLLSVAAQAQSPWRLQLLDSAGFTPTAMGTVENLMAVASQPDGSPLFPPSGDLRLRIHPIQAQTGNLLAPTVSLQFPGKFVVNHIAGMGNLAIARFLMAGGFQDTCFLPNDTLIGFEPLSLDPFLMRVNAHTGQPEWVWSRSQAQNNFIHKIHYDEVQNTILASGLYDDVSGWVAAFDPVNGQLLWEKAWPGARTVSDARYDPVHAGAILFTGTISDFGQLNNIPTPLTPLPNTGYRTFLARYWPANDSVQFIATTPYGTFDFEPGILVDNPVPLRTATSWQQYLWCTPSEENGQEQMISSIGGSWPNTTIQTQLWHGHFEPGEQHISNGPLFFYQAAGAAPGEHVAKWHRGQTDSLWLSPNSQPGRAGAVAYFSSYNYLTVKATGPIRIKGDGWNRDSSYAVPGASVNEPRWVVLHRSTALGGSVVESAALKFKHYPNPVTAGEIYIETEHAGVSAISWKLHDLQGRALATGRLELDASRIALPHVAAGVYLLELKQGEKRGWSRVVVQ